MLKVGMLTSGGDCQSLNATMRGVANRYINYIEKMLKLSVFLTGIRVLYMKSTNLCKKVTFQVFLPEAELYWEPAGKLLNALGR